MSTEFEKMRKGEMANTSDIEIQKRIIRAKRILLKLNNTYFESEEHRVILEELIPNFPKTSTICPPFYCDYLSWGKDRK